jgi:hypothetical protein
MSEITVASVLEETRNLLPDAEHWLKNKLVQNGDCFCIRGAVFAAGAKLNGETYNSKHIDHASWLWDIYHDIPAVRAADALLTKLARARRRLPDWDEVVEFNNHRDTTFDDIRGLLDDAIEEARNPARHLPTMEFNHDHGDRQSTR